MFFCISDKPAFEIFEMNLMANVQTPLSRNRVPLCTLSYLAADKIGQPYRPAGAFKQNLGAELLSLHHELTDGNYQPGSYEFHFPLPQMV